MWYGWGEGSSQLMSLAKETHHSLKAVDLNLGFQMPHHFPIPVTGYWSSGSHLFTFTPFPQLLHFENKGGSPHQQHDACSMSVWVSDFYSLESFWQEVIICSPQILVCIRLSWGASPIPGDSVGLGCHCISYKFPSDADAVGPGTTLWVAPKASWAWVFWIMPGHRHWVSGLMILAGSLFGRFHPRAIVGLGMAGLDILAWARQAEGTLPIEVSTVPPHCHFPETDHLSQSFSNFNMNVDHLQILFKCRFWFISTWVDAKILHF